MGVLAEHLAPLKEISVFASVPVFTPYTVLESRQSPSLAHMNHVVGVARLPRGWGWDLQNYIRPSLELLTRAL